MIFVTVGTHEQPFNRLVEYMDEWAKKHNEKVVIQTGFSTYKPKFAEYKSLYSYQEMQEKVQEARIVITHGGPSSFIMPLQIGKTPVVVPRCSSFGEHVNDHQVKFCREVEKRMKNIICVENIEQLSEIIEHYDERKTTISQKSNNALFCEKLEKMVEDLMRS